MKPRRPPCCMRTDCDRRPVAAYGLNLRAPEALVRALGKDEVVKRLVSALVLCDVHAAEAEEDGPFGVFDRASLEPIAAAVRKATMTAVDLDRSIPTRIALNDPEYRLVIRQREAARGREVAFAVTTKDP